MPYGLYTVHQVSGWEGRELIADFDVFIKDNSETYSFLINNANFRSFLRVVKKDSETGKTIPYAGAGFQIYNPSGKRISMKLTYPEVKTIDTFYTSSDGTLTTPQSLEYGKGYKLVEVQAPYGYVLDSTPISFDVTKENAQEIDKIPVIKVTRANAPQKGTITVTKNGEVFSSVSEAKGIYQPIYAVKGLSGAVFTITAAEDIVTPDGTCLCHQAVPFQLHQLGYAALRPGGRCGIPLCRWGLPVCARSAPEPSGTAGEDPGQGALRRQGPGDHPEPARADGGGAGYPPGRLPDELV